MKKILFFLTLALWVLFSCKSPVKQQEDSIYSRHLQRHVALTIITTPMPDNKSDMNLLIVCAKSFTDDARAKEILDSMYRLKLIQPVIIVAFSGKSSYPNDVTINEYGPEEAPTDQAEHCKKLNDFIVDELYPFAKKNTGIRKFNSVAVCGNAEAAITAFDIAWNYDEKIQKAGMFAPSFTVPGTTDDSTIINAITASRKRPVIQVWMADYGGFPQEEKFKEMIRAKKSISNFTVQDMNGNKEKTVAPVNRFADFLLWAFPK